MVISISLGKWHPLIGMRRFGCRFPIVRGGIGTTKAVNKIAAIQRGRKSRAKVQEIKEQTQAVNKIAAIQRGRKSRAQVQEIKEQTKAAVKIQAIHRGRRSRSVSRTRDVDNDINNYDNNNYNDDEDLSSEEEMDEEECAENRRVEGELQPPPHP